MTNTTQSPSDAELRMFVQALIADDNSVRTNDEQDHMNFARAVLARWGAPAAVVEPAATVIKSGANRQWMSERLGHLPDGIYSLYLAPPTQPAALIAELRGYLAAAADGSMSRNNSESLAFELLERLDKEFGITTQGDSNAD